MRGKLLFCLGLVSGLAASGQWKPADPPAAAGSGMPYLATAPNGEVFVSWIDPGPGAGHALRFSRWTGRAWTPPETIAQGANWFVNWADFPALAALPDGSLLAHWLARPESGGKYGYGIRVARRGPAAGAPWRESASMNLGDPDDYAGFLSFSGAGAAYLAPPANRRPGSAHGTHGEGESHEKTLRFVRFRTDGTAASDVELDPDVCTCCPTASVSTPKGLLVAYRDHLPGEIRDISIVRYADGAWSKPRTLHADGWRINGCPTEGPSIASSGSTVAIAWATRAGDIDRLQVALSTDGSETFRAPIRADDGNPSGRPSLIAIDESQSLLAWLEKTESGAEIRLRRIYASGRAAPSLTVAKVPLSRATGLPKIAIHKGQVLAAWRDGRVRVAVTALANAPSAPPI